ncbi:dihydrofolate reductase family protein [Intrasporangium sp.]|uniref:dihydrofolate reductase family protein n=1 Tax=Intrasporangium sp. TaxID=1925024 RepID=UPI00293ABE54|nr:dihydrofolate reductase family protein [Intrasporangium sp.]MDV3223294.1 dihydrofolate reductase family protein [Intrasporangium sp.]
MSKVIAGITTSVDGYVAGPDDGPGRGLGTGGERLHHWVFGGPWTYDEGPRGEATAEDKVWLESVMARVGAVVAGRGTYEASERWGDRNPWPVPLFVVTHRPHEQPDAGKGFTFVGDLATAIARAKQVAGDLDVHLMGGADAIRQALAAGLVDELTMIIAPVILGGGKGLFDGFELDLDLEHLGVRQSAHATFVDYRVVPPLRD